MVLDLILNSFGLTTIDNNLQGLIEAMGSFPTNSLTGYITGWAKLVGLGIALGVGSYECYMMILGRRGMDVMKLLYIVIISLCITGSGYISQAARAPGDGLKDLTRELALSQNAQVQQYEEQVADQQQKYLKAVREVKLKLDEQKTTDERTWYQAILDGDVDGYISDKIDELKENTNNWLMGAALTAETTVTNWINAIVRFICELLFQVAYYGMLIAQDLFLLILSMFCPIAFALSLAPPFRSAWSQWLSKYLSVSLWGFVIYMILYYVSYIMLYNLDLDLKAYTQLTKDVADNMTELDWQTVGQIGMQSLGTTAMYVVGLLVGVFLLKFVPEVASWLIPGGVSSGAGGAAAGVATGGASKAVGAASAATGTSSITGAPTRAATNFVDKKILKLK